jgi:hypothetical protein
MKLSTARELKNNIIALIRDRVLRAHIENAEKRISARFASAKPGGRPLAAPEGVAVGIAPQGGNKNGFKLAVRVLDRGSALSDVALRSLPVLEEDDLDLAHGVTYEPRYTVRAGGSCGHFRITAGTLGGFVEDEDNYYILSNNHVLADSGWGHLGDPIWQPGPGDVAGGRYKVIGSLARVLPLKILGTASIDAALATMSGDVSRFDPWSYAGIGQMNPRVVTDRYAVEPVVKRGRTTKVTRGQVSAFELDGVRINYGTEHAPRVVTFDNQMEFVHVKPPKPFSQPGDSGSFILDASTLRPVALLFSGGLDDNKIDRTLGHFMRDVLDALGVRLIRKSRALVRPGAGRGQQLAIPPTKGTKPQGNRHG